MSTNVDDSPKGEKEVSETSTPEEVVVVDKAADSVPIVAEHQALVDAIWPTLMKEVAGMFFGSICEYNVFYR